MEEQEVKEYYGLITSAWRTLKGIFEQYPDDYTQKEAFVRESNTKIAANAAKDNHPYGNILAIVNQAELMRIAYGCEVKISLKFPDGKVQTVGVINNEM